MAEQTLLASETASGKKASGGSKQWQQQQRVAAGGASAALKGMCLYSSIARENKRRNISSDAALSDSMWHGLSLAAAAYGSSVAASWPWRSNSSGDSTTAAKNSIVSCRTYLATAYGQLALAHGEKA